MPISRLPGGLKTATAWTANRTVVAAATCLRLRKRSNELGASVPTPWTQCLFRMRCRSFCKRQSGDDSPFSSQASWSQPRFATQRFYRVMSRT